MHARLRSHRAALRVAFAAAAIAALAVGLLAHASTARRAAPALPAAALDGRAVTLADLRGRPAAVVFFASWCTDCHVEAGAIERVARTAAWRGRIVGVDYDDGGDWRRFLREYGWSFPVLDDHSGVVGAAYGINVLPATVVLDASGRIVEVRYGAQTVAGLTAALRSS